jgi:hypothetical protein
MRYRPARPLEQLHMGWVQLDEILEMLAVRALIDCGVELQEHLVPSPCGMYGQRPISSLHRAVGESVRKTEVQKAGRSKC